MSDEQSKPTSPDAHDRIMDHSYDGIQEYDNPMPRWWVWIFWGTFWFSLAYVFHYWVGNGVSVADAYAEDVRIASEAAAREALQVEVSEESLGKLLQDPGGIEAGKAVFQGRCVACHLEGGQGSIGPNLTDDYWIHGKGSLLEIYSTVSEGVAAKGMPAWTRQLTPTELRQVVAFVGTLRGMHLEGKPPEGELVGPVGGAQPEAGGLDSEVDSPSKAPEESPGTTPTGE